MQQVREIMSKDLKIASPEDTIKKAAQLMAATNCGALPVGENGRLLGIVTDRDITLRAVSKGNAPNHCTVREVMSSRIKYVFEDEATHVVAHSMSKLQVRRLLVLNRQKRLVGIVSLSDLALKHDGPAAASTLKQVSRRTLAYTFKAVHNPIRPHRCPLSQSGPSDASCICHHHGRNPASA
jgi:CBS domain-containing protein